MHFPLGALSFSWLGMFRRWDILTTCELPNVTEAEDQKGRSIFLQSSCRWQHQIIQNSFIFFFKFVILSLFFQKCTLANCEQSSFHSALTWIQILEQIIWNSLFWIGCVKLPLLKKKNDFIIHYFLLYFECFIQF